MVVKTSKIIIPLVIIIGVIIVGGYFLFFSVSEVNSNFVDQEIERISSEIYDLELKINNLEWVQEELKWEIFQILC